MSLLVFRTPAAPQPFGRFHGIIHPPAQRHDPAPGARRPRRTQGRRTGPWWIHRQDGEYISPQRSDGFGPSTVTARRRTRHRVETKRCRRRGRGPLLLFSNADCRISLSRRGEAMPFHVRYVDGDLLCFVHEGSGSLETEFGRWPTAPATGSTAQGVHLATAARYGPKRLADDRGHRRVPGAPAGTLGGAGRSIPAQAVIPEPRPRRRRPRQNTRYGSTTARSRV